MWQIQFHVCVQKLHSHNSERIIKIDPQSYARNKKGTVFLTQSVYRPMPCTVHGLSRNLYMPYPRTYYLLISSASATEASSDTLSTPGEGCDLRRHDDSHFAGPVRCRGERRDEADDEGDETVSVMVAPPRALVQLNKHC